jgi:hypothetical protein
MLVQSWNGSLTLGPSLVTMGLTADNRSRPPIAPSPGGAGAPYGSAWIGAFEYALPALEEYSDSRDAMATLSIKGGSSKEYLSASLSELTAPAASGTWFSARFRLGADCLPLRGLAGLVRALLLQDLEGQQDRLWRRDSRGRCGRVRRFCKPASALRFPALCRADIAAYGRGFLVAVRPVGNRPPGGEPRASGRAQPLARVRVELDRSRHAVDARLLVRPLPREGPPTKSPTRACGRLPLNSPPSTYSARKAPTPSDCPSPATSTSRP